MTFGAPHEERMSNTTVVCYFRMDSALVQSGANGQILLSAAQITVCVAKRYVVK